MVAKRVAKKLRKIEDEPTATDPGPTDKEPEDKDRRGPDENGDAGGDRGPEGSSLTAVA